MPPWDIRALTRPAFSDSEFSTTKHSTAADKAWFANALARFIASDFPAKQWTDRLYTRLSLTFSNIAHYNKHGFYAEYFETTAGKVTFLEQTITHPCWGDPAYTYSDVERAVIRRLRACGVLPFTRAVNTAHVEAAERALLARLHAKYAGQAAPELPPQPIMRAEPIPKAGRREDARQTSLI